jgi:hypothetical protein
VNVHVAGCVPKGHILAVHWPAKARTAGGKRLAGSYDRVLREWLACIMRLARQTHVGGITFRYHVSRESQNARRVDARTNHDTGVGAPCASQDSERDAGTLG